MSDPASGLQRFLAELKRRRVYRVAAAYAVVGWIVIEFASVVLPALHLPEWTTTFVVVLALLGFPVALVLAWAFDVTPDGVHRTKAAGTAGGERLAGDAGAPVGSVLLAAVGILVAATGGWYVLGSRTGSSAITDRSIAVLPFEPLGGEPDAFTEGMHDDLLTRLSNVADLTVTSRTSVQRYRGTDQDLREIARELGVRWILEGGVQQVGDQVQVNAQLTDPRTDSHVWAESYRRTVTPQNLFTIQGEITSKIARALHARISPAERRRLQRRPTENLEAYRLYVQGRAHLDRRTEVGMRRAVELFRQAIALDSTYALAWSGLADGLLLLGSYSHAALDTMLAPARAAADRAIRLSPDQAEAHASVAHVHMIQEPADVPATIRRLERAIELKPSYARAHHWLGLVSLAAGRRDAGLRHARRAVELDPGSSPIQITLAWAYWHEGAVEPALQHARRALQLEPTFAFNHMAYGLILLNEGRGEDARPALRRAIELAPEGSFTWAWAMAALVHTRAAADDTAGAGEVARRIEHRAGGSAAAAMAYAALGQRERVFRVLRATTWSIESADIVRNSPILAPVRRDPRFDAVRRRMNRDLGLEPDGAMPPDAHAGERATGTNARHRLGDDRRDQALHGSAAGDAAALQLGEDFGR